MRRPSMPGLIELTPCTGCASKRGAAARRPSLSNWPEGGPPRNASAGMAMSPMSSTGGGGGGGGGGTRLRRLLLLRGSGFGLGFELLAAGFFVVVAGFAGAGSARPNADASSARRDQGRGQIRGTRK